MTAPRNVSPARLAWLENELARWQADDLVSPENAVAISSGYVASRRVTLTRLIVGLGAAFVAVGLIWTVAANLDRLSPLVRFTAVVALWLALVVLAQRITSPLFAQAAHLIAAAAFGAVIFQAAQSLQVPAYSSALVGWWAAGTLLYGYANRSFAPIALGVVLATIWWIWLVAGSANGPAPFVIAALAASVPLTAIAVAHRPSGRTDLAAIWWAAAAVLTLLAHFIAAMPFERSPGEDFWPPHAAGLLGGCLTVSLAVLLVTRPQRGVAASEVVRVLAPVAASVVVAGAGMAMVAWTGQTDGVTRLSARVVVAVLVYLLVAGWIAVLGVWLGLPLLTWLAMAALVLFTTVQSFAVFAPITTGAPLFLIVGAVLLGTGVLVTKGRRRLTPGPTAGSSQEGAA